MRTSPAPVAAAQSEPNARWLRLAAAAASMLLLALWARDAMPHEPMPAVAASHDTHALAARLAERTGSPGGTSDAAAWALLARTHAVQGQWPQASAAFEQATALAPQDAALWAERARAAAAQHSANALPAASFAARNWVQRALQLDAHQPLALALAGDWAYADGDLPTAQRHWRLAVRHSSHLAQAEPGLPQRLQQRLAAVDDALAATHRALQATAASKN
jgi:tetratricopeptide (TPR) repeat protein